jgi:hypothetical protein
MSITVRRWTEKELQKVKRAKTEEERWLATILMNSNDFSAEEMKALSKIPIKKQHEYDVVFDCEDNAGEITTIRATDVKMLRKFISAEYTCPADEIVERICKYKMIQRRDGDSDE